MCLLRRLSGCDVRIPLGPAVKRIGITFRWRVFICDFLGLFRLWFEDSPVGPVNSSIMDKPHKNDGGLFLM